MHALKQFSTVITFAAFSLSGSAAWAQNSFVATAGVNGFRVVPSILTSLRGTLTLPFRISPPTTTEETIERRPRNPWTFNGRQPQNEGGSIFNIRLYIGQHFANGQPIATLCDDNIDDNIPDNIPELECVEIGDGNDQTRIFKATKEFELRDIQFPKRQATIPGVGMIGGDGRVENDASGLKVLQRLINRGLIYVVINSAFTAKLGPDGIIYTAPAPGIVDGELRGALRLVPPKN